MASYGKDKQKIKARLSRIEGQIRGVQRMVDNDKYCVDILTQVSSIIAASHRVGQIILKDHIKGCVKDAVASKNGDKSVEEVMQVIERFIKA